jgi:hypothetical protein
MFRLVFFEHTLLRGLDAVHFRFDLLENLSFSFFLGLRLLKSKLFDELVAP